jgi:hypothetical protein
MRGGSGGGRGGGGGCGDVRQMIPTKNTIQTNNSQRQPTREGAKRQRQQRSHAFCQERKKKSRRCVLASPRQSRHTRRSRLPSASLRRTEPASLRCLHSLRLAFQWHPLAFLWQRQAFPWQRQDSPSQRGVSRLRRRGSPSRQLRTGTLPPRPTSYRRRCPTRCRRRCPTPCRSRCR